MTEHQPGSREWAEAEARKGAKVRREEWPPHVWVSFRDGEFYDQDDRKFHMWVWEHGRWSIYEPAPAQAPDLAARVAELERRFNGHYHVAPTIGGQTSRPLPLVDEVEPAPTVTTSRKPADPAPGVMTDAEIIGIVTAYYKSRSPKSPTPFNDAVRETIRRTRASDRAAREARRAEAQEAFWAAYDKASAGSVRTQAFAGFRAALAAYENGE